jgi:hypothetical protein
MYNDLPHRWLFNFKYSPNNIFKNYDLLNKKFLNNIEKENKNIPKYNIGDVVRKIKNNTVFDKEKSNFSDELYIIVNIIKNRYRIENLKTSQEDKKLYKYNELLLTKNTGFNNNEENENQKNYNKNLKVDRQLKKEGVENKNIINNNDLNNDNNNIKNRLRNNKRNIFK